MALCENWKRTFWFFYIRDSLSIASISMYFESLCKYQRVKFWQENDAMVDGVLKLLYIEK